MTQGLGIAVLAAIAMTFQDMLGVIMVQAEATNKGWLAGSCDTAGWYLSIATTALSINALNGHGFWPKLWVLTIVGSSNMLGTKLGQVMGAKVLKRKLTFQDKMAIQAESRK
jgi:hypothetical protein